MEDLLKIADDEITINPHFVGIQVIYDIWKRDHGQSQKDKLTDKSVRVKHIARRELSWIYFMENWKSIYQSYTDRKRRAQKIKAVLGLPEEWEEDKVLKEAREWYASEQTATNLELNGLNAAKKALGAIEEFLETINLVDSTNKMPNGAAIFKPKDITGAIKELNFAQKSVKEMEENVRKAQSTEKKVRGGGAIGMYES